MDRKLVKAAITGDKRILDELLQQKEFSFEASDGAITITLSDDVTLQKVTNCLLGVTHERNTAFHIVASLEHLELA